MINFAFIFARGGSKGLPRKNVKMLMGKPLIQYSIEAAKESPSIQEVFVSTEDDEIAEISRSLGAIVIQRPDELATDHAPEWLAWRHAIKYVEDNYGQFDNFISLPATSPLRSVEDIESAISKIGITKSNICLSITPASRNPYFNMVKKHDDGLVSLLNQTNNMPVRRQDSPVAFDVTTVVYVAEPSFIMRNENIFDGKVTAVEVPKHRAIDIDDIYDFLFAETMLKGDQ